MNKNKIVPALWITLGILALACIMFSIAYFKVQNNALEYKNQLEYVYERSFYDLVDNINNLEVNLSKLSATKGEIARKQLTAKIISQANMAQNNLAVLPIDTNEIENTISFVNYVNGYITTINQKLGRHQDLSADELENIDNLYEVSKKVKEEVNHYAVMVEGDYKILDNASSSMYELSKFSQTFSTLKEPSIDYPQLIYDGPFSDSVLNKEVKGLIYPIITQAKSDEIIKNMKNTLNFTSFCSCGEGKGKIPTFDYRLNFSDGSHAFMQLTQSGGKLLTYARNIEPKIGKLEQDKYVYNALNFANAMGYQNLESVWIENAKDGVYINLATIKNNVIAYPDLIKVKLSTDSGVICGFEASSYFYNHTDRPSKNVKISKNDAMKLLPNDLEITNIRLCIIPGEYVGELYAYEFACEKNDNKYFIYIDANTGEQEKIMRVVNTDDGELLM